MHAKESHFLHYCNCVVFSILTQIAPEVSATEIVASGTCGEQIQWALDDTCVLTLTGQGEMSDCLKLIQRKIH